MRKLHLLLSVTMLTVTVQAQNEAKENTALSTEKKELLAQSGKVVPYPLQVAYDQTTHLIFPASIRYVDLGSENLVADKVKDAENVLRVKAAKTDFTDSTNLSVITQDGGFYSFEVSYHTTPQPLTIDFGRGMPQGNNVKSDILFSDTGWESPAVAQIIMSSIYHQKKNYIKHIGSENTGIQWLLKGIYVHNSKLYVDVQLSNRSNLPFEVDFITFKIIDKKTTKKSIVQEVPVEPLRVYQPISLLKAHKEARSVYMLDQLTLSDDKVLRVEIFEKNGSRYQSFLITNEEIIAARPIEQFNLKF